jgi:hypothetical protein
VIPRLSFSAVLMSSFQHVFARKPFLPVSLSRVRPKPAILLTGFTSSNGLGGNGTIPDCGYRYADSMGYAANDTVFWSTCPVNDDGEVRLKWETDVVLRVQSARHRGCIRSSFSTVLTGVVWLCDVQVCSGHGTCDAASSTCTCDTGYSKFRWIVCSSAGLVGVCVQ